MDRVIDGARDGAGEPAADDIAEVRRRIDEHGVWYHTIDVGPGVTTPGWFDLRHAADGLPWPEVAGARCLDIGTFDGFYAFELERRGAAEVIGVDVADHRLLDWPPDARDTDLRADPVFPVPPPGDGFRLVAALTGSAATWRPVSIYDLSPETVGTFDVVVLGSLLLHLRDPIRALEAVRSVVRPDGWFLSAEQIEQWMTLTSPRKAMFTLRGSGPDCQWFNANAAGHRRMVYAAGFEVARRTKPFVLEFNRHPPRPRTAAALARRLGSRGLTGGWREGVLHQALLARPRV